MISFLPEPHPSTGDRRYFIPVESLVDVSLLHGLKVEEIKVEQEVIEQEEIFEFTKDIGAGSDIPFSAMSLRDYAAIKWHKPVSQKIWLNELISKTFNL